MKADLFPTTELKDLTLTQLLLEHERDWVDYHGLQKGVLWAARHFGLEHATKIAKQKFSLLPSQETLEQRLKQEAAELAENEREIRSRAEAWEEGSYRERKLVEKVQQRLETLRTEVSLEDLKKISVFIDDHHRAVKEQLESSGELARQRQEALNEKHPDLSLRRVAGKIKNYLIDNRRILVPAAVGIVFGAAGSGGAYKYFSNQDRNRPTEEVGYVIASEHPGVQAAVAVTDVVRTGNKVYKEYKYGDEKKFQDRKEKITASLAKVQQAKSETKEVMEYYAGAGKNIGNLSAGTQRIWQAWHHDTNKSGHWEERCTTTTDSKGRTQRSCHNVYVCDYIDHTWTFNVSTAAPGVELYLQGLNDIEKVTPETANQTEMETQLRAFLSKDKKYSSLSVDDQVKQTLPYSDIFTSITVAGNNRLSNLLSTTNSNNFVFVKNNHANDYIFSHETRERDHGCSSRGSPPQAYVVSESLLAETTALVGHYNNVMGRLGNTSNHLLSCERALQKLATAGDRSPIEEHIQQVGDIAITLQDEINPDSAYSMLTSSWRTAIPFILLFGLGIGAGYAGVSAYDRRRKQREFLGKYGAY